MALGSSGGDLFVSHSGLYGLNLVALDATPDDWNQMSAAEVLEATRAVAAPAAKIPLGAADPLPRTYLIRTREGASGILQITEFDGESGSDEGPFPRVEIQYRLVGTNSRSKQEGDRPAILPSNDAPLWLSMLPYEESVRSLGQLRLLVQARGAYGSEHFVQSTEWEIRTSDNAKRIASIPIDWPWPKSREQLRPDGTLWKSWGNRTGSYRFSEGQIHRVGRLPEGDYVMAWNVNGRRLSSVVAFRLDAQYDPKGESLLSLAQAEVGPEQDLPMLALRARRHVETDPAPLATAIAFAELIVDGTARRRRSVTWRGPDVPLAVGGHYVYPVLLDDYAHDRATEAAYGCRHRRGPTIATDDIAIRPRRRASMGSRSTATSRRAQAGGIAHRHGDRSGRPREPGVRRLCGTREVARSIGLLAA